MTTLWDLARRYPRRAGAVAAALGGAIAITIGWLGASGAIYTAQQVPYLISGGLGGLFLLGVGAVLWVSDDLNRQSDDVRTLAEAAARLLDDEEAEANDAVR